MAAEKVGIEVELMGGKEAFDLLKRIDGQIDTLNRKKKFKSLSGLNSAKSELEGYMNDLKKLNKEQEKWANLSKKVGKENMSAFGVREWDRVKKSIQETQNKIKQMGSEMDSVTQKTRTWAQTFNSASSRIAHIGSAMQSLGNGLTRLTSPFRRLTTGLLMGAGYKALNMFTEGFSGAFERADIMRNYSRSLEAFGFSATDASNAIEELNESVLGLPTGLDEIVALQKKYVAASQDIEKSTALAIATNNSFLASGSDARQRKTAERIISQLAGGAEIASSSWDALQRAMPLVFTTLAKESKMGVADYMSALKQGKISTDEFMASFSRIGKEGAIADAANVMKQSWAGLTANIQNATKRMGTGIIESLNSVFKDKTGRTLLQRLLGVDADGKDMGDGIKHWIDDLSASVQNWIKSHPEEILDFFNNLKNIDWKGLLKGVAEGAKWMADIVASFAKWASDKDMSKIGRWGAKLNVLGWGLSTFGGVLKGLRHPLAAIWTIVAKGIGGRFGKIGLIGKLMEFFGGKNARAAKEIPTISETFKNAFHSLSGLMKVAGAVLISSGTAFVVTEAAKRGIQNFKTALNLLKDINWDDAKKLLAGIGGYLAVSAVVGGVIGNVKGGAKVAAGVAIGEVFAGLITSIATGFFALDMGFIRDGIRNFSEAVGYVHDAVDGINKIQELGNLGTLADKISTIREQLWKIKDVFEGKQGDKKDRGVVEKGMPQFSKDVVNSMKNISDAVANMKTGLTNLNALATMGININIASKIEQIQRAFSAVAKALNGENGQGALPIIGADKVSSMENLAKAVEHMHTLVDNLNSIATVGLNQNILVKLQQIKRAIREVEVTFSTMFNNIQGPANLSKNANSMADGIRGLRRVVWQLNQLAGLEVNNGGITAVVGQIKTALQELQGLSGLLELDIQVKLTSKFKTSVNTVVKQINAGKKRIQDAMKKIPSAITKHISVTITASVNTRSAVASITRGAERVRAIADSIHPAKGGMVYRAKGGSIPWKRRGTDTVPAMLTPGEYVHNKRAVSTFGIDFMRKVNNLDVKGAMNELMHKAGGMANVNRGATVNYYNNNNQKVVINNNGNPGAGFTFKSASRFVGAI